MSDSQSQPTPEEIIAEAERRRTAGPTLPIGQAQPDQDFSPAARRVVVGLDRVIFWFSKHWLAIFNTLAFLYVGLPFLAPLLAYWGLDNAANFIYRMYGPLCHQYAQRSWYLFGDQFAYTIEEIKLLVPGKRFFPWAFRADPLLGYQVAFCQRDVAIYGTILLAGLVYGFVRRWLRPMPLWAYLLFGIGPMALDGGIQLLFDAVESNPIRRVVTGALFGLATVWFAYPYLEESAVEVLETLEKRFGWKR